MMASGRAAGARQRKPERRRGVPVITAGLISGVLLLFMATAVRAQPVFELNGITLEDAPGEFTVIIWSDPPVADFSYAFPRKPPRMTLQLPGKWRRPDKRIYPLENDTVRKITVAREPDHLAVTLHLKTGHIFEPFVHEAIKGLIITIKKSHLFTEPLPEGVEVKEAAGEKEDARLTASPEVAGGEILNVSVEPLPEGFRLKISLNRDNEGYSTFTLPDEDPPKVVLDLKGRWRNPGPTVRESGNDAIRRIRVGEHRDFLRIVADLKAGVTPEIEADADGREVVLDVRLSE